MNHLNQKRGMVNRPIPSGAVHPPAPSDVLVHLGTLAREMDRATALARELGDEFASARSTHRVARAEAFLRTLGKGSIKDREAMTDIAVAREQLIAESTEQRLRAARERIGTLRAQLSAEQSIGAWLRAEATALPSSTWGA